MALTTAQVQTAYLAYFARPADPTGLQFWTTIYTGTDIQALLAQVSTAPEFTSTVAGKSNFDIVSSLYINMLGRTAANIDVAGALFWTGLLDAGTIKVADVAYQIYLSAQTTSDKAVIDAKVAASTAFTAALDTAAEISAYQGANALTIANAYLLGITDTATSTAKIATLPTVTANLVSGSAGGSGQTYTLTDSTDVVPGTSGNDTIIAGTKAAAATLTAGDSITGGLGTDTINLFDNVNATAFTGANVAGVEVVNAYFNTTGGTLNVSGNSGVTQANIGTSIVTSVSPASGTATVTLTKAQKAGITGTITNDVATSNAANNVAVTFAFSDVTGGADTATLALSSAKFALNAANLLGTGNGVTIAGVETLNIEATGANNIGTLTAAATETLNISGAGSVSLAGVGGTFKVVDASTNTGGVTVDISAAAANDLKVTGGTGNDEITVDYANLNKLDVINLGNGTDTLGFKVTNVDFTTAALVGNLAGVTGVEALKVNGALTFKADAALLSQTSFIDNSTGAMTLTNVANTDSVTIGGVATAASSIALELGQNTLGLTLAGTATAAADATNLLTLTGSTTVNVASNGTAGMANNVLNIITADNNTFNVTGSQNLTLTVAVSGGVTGQTVNASAFTGKLTVTGTALADAITGGTGADTITGGAGSDTLKGNAGADTFSFVGTAGSTQSGGTFGSFDTISDFVAGTDKLQFTGVADVVSGQQGAVQAAVTALAAASTATQIATAMAAANTTNLGVSFAVFEGNTYVLYETAGAGAGVVADDVFIKLTGVSVLPTFAADVVA